MIARAMTKLDRRYVVPTWANGSRYGRLAKRERFTLVDRILDRGADCVVLATDERTVHAWACGEAGVLHYAYVPPELRMSGLARRVITELLGEYAEHIDITHDWPWHSSRFQYSPHLLLREAA